MGVFIVILRVSWNCCGYRYWVEIDQERPKLFAGVPRGFLRTKTFTNYAGQNPWGPLPNCPSFRGGGFGQTFLAEDLHLPGNPQCVVKQLKPRMTNQDALKAARRLFDAEAQALYSLGNHDQIPRLFAHFEENRDFYLVQEFVEGQVLTQEIKTRKQFSETEVINLLQDILTVLDFVHQQQVVHRDIKPSNLMRRGEDGRIILIDFGAVKQIGMDAYESPDQASVTIAVGSSGYMPNEQLAGKPRFSSDIYAVGMLAIQCLTGVYPKKLKEDPKPVRLFGETRYTLVLSLPIFSIKWCAMTFGSATLLQRRPLLR